MGHLLAGEFDTIHPFPVGGYPWFPASQKKVWYKYQYKQWVPGGECLEAMQQAGDGVVPARLAGGRRARQVAHCGRQARARRRLLPRLHQVPAGWGIFTYWNTHSIIWKEQQVHNRF